MEMKVYPNEDTLKKIRALKEPSKREYYELFYYMIVDHFVAYRLLSSK